MDQTVLIVSDDAEFSRLITARWQSESSIPAFTLMGGDLCQDLDPETFDLAIVGGVRSSLLTTALKALDPPTKPVLFICEDAQYARDICHAQPRVMPLVQQPGWLDALVLITSEALCCCAALERARLAEQTTARAERQAALGRYAVEMRHTLNNALTSILGNAELLLLEPEPLSLGSRSQLETVRNSAVRMHEIFQRFWSIDKELSVLEKQPNPVTTPKSQVAVSGL